MGLFQNKQPLLIDLDLGITGTFVEFQEETTEKGYVYPVFTPLNSLRKIRYANPIQKAATTLVWPKTNHKGAEESLMIIYRGDPDGLIKIVDSKFSERVRELEEQLQSLEIENQALKQDLRDSKEGLQKEMSRIKGLEKAKPNNPLDIVPDKQQHKSFFEDLG